MSRVPLMLSYSITATRRPLTDEELTELAETRPITVLFVGDHSYSTISKEQFLIYAQSQLNMMNAAFAENKIKLKMKVYDTYVMNEEQDRTHLQELPGRQVQSIDPYVAHETLKTKIVEYPGSNESDMVFVFTRKVLRNATNEETYLYWYYTGKGPCGGRLEPNIFYDAPFSYQAIVQSMWDTTLVRIAKEDVCDVEHLEQCYQHLIPAYNPDKHASTTTMSCASSSNVEGNTAR
ncbi:uncharacterized protein LOC135376218 isoform X3 [Ornithodoros turicata]|uniref:uncharacterized protein LOC135376218 isoform X3 n=1 Tax=Ornithodoros turicata TaxID=34597 RepID=UPI0031386907